MDENKHDLAISNGSIYDGSGRPPTIGDIAIKGDRIVAVGVVQGGAAREIDARGNYETACRHLESPLAIDRIYQVACDEADTLQLWRGVLAAAGDHANAAEKFDASIENHRSRGVGPRLLS